MNANGSGAPNTRGLASRVAAIIALVLALLAGWYAVGLGWSVIFLLDEAPVMSIFGIVVLIAPVLFTLVAIFTWRGSPSVALWLLAPLALKWVAASVWAWTEGGFSELVARLPGVSLSTMLAEGYVDTYPLDQFILLIAQFQVEPFATIAVAALLFGALRRSRVE